MKLPATTYKDLGRFDIPKFSGLRIMMMPVVIGDMDCIKHLGFEWQLLYGNLCNTAVAKDHIGEVGYLTLDEKTVGLGETHRNSGLHVDSVYRPEQPKPLMKLKVITETKIVTQVIHTSTGTSAGSWGSRDNGMIVLSAPEGCRVWDKDWMEADLANGDGGCEHLRRALGDDEGHLIPENHAYWLGGLCIHESIPMLLPQKRQFIRLSLPNDGPWFEHYTPNPNGILPSGDVLPKSAR